MARLARRCSGMGGPTHVQKNGHRTRVGGPHRLTCRCSNHQAMRDYFAAQKPEPPRVVVMSRTRAARDQSDGAKGGA